MNAFVRIAALTTIAFLALGLGSTCFAQSESRSIFDADKPKPTPTPTPSPATPTPQPARAAQPTPVAQSSPVARPPQISSAVASMHLRGVLSSVNPWRKEIVIQDPEGHQTVKCHTSTFILTETSESLSSIPTTTEVSVLGTWEGDSYRFQDVRWIAIPPIPPELMLDGGATGFLLGNVGNVSLKTPERIIPLDIESDSVVVVRPGSLNHLRTGLQVEAWGREVGNEKLCDRLSVFNLTRRILRPIATQAQPTAGSQSSGQRRR